MSDSDSFQLIWLLPGSAAAAYNAWIDPEQLQQWFRPDETYHLALVETDLRTGGDFRLDLIDPEGQPVRFGGLYRRLDPPRRLVFTWHWADDLGIDGLSEDTYVEIVLAETASSEYLGRLSTGLVEAADQTTTLTLFHDEFLTEADLIWHKQFWQGILGQLANFLADEERLRTEDG